jgi:hypothetical protein
VTREMKKSVKWLGVCILPVILLVTSCADPSVDNTVLSPVEEASRIIGLPIPMPEYLPEGYEVRSVDVEGDAEHRFWDISVLISKSGTDNESLNSISMGIHWLSLGLKLETERIMIGESSALAFRDPDRPYLLWIDSEGRQITLAGNANLEFDELVRIAESVTSPPKEILDASLEPDGDLLVPRNSSERLTVHLRNNSFNPVKVAISRDDDLPDEIRVHVQDDSFTLQAGESKDIAIDVEVGQDTPSPSWRHRTAEEVFPEDTPPPYSPILETPYYRLAFTYSYELSRVMSRPERLSTRLLIDPPERLPAGMIDLQEAEAAADFPVGALLPAYLPAGTEPPPTCYIISPDEPHCITAVYSHLRVTLCPEPGITEPPGDVSGERTVIRKKQVVIGQNRIDWWIYDIHFSVVSNEIPMDELKLVAKSMMQVGPFTNSWLDYP